MGELGAIYSFEAIVKVSSGCWYSLGDRAILFVCFGGNVWVSFLGVKMYAESKFASLSRITWSVVV